MRGPEVIYRGESRDFSANVAMKITHIKYVGRAAYIWEIPTLDPTQLFNDGKIKSVNGQYVGI